MSEGDITANAPVAPACFPSRTVWVQYLASAQESKTTATKPFTRGAFNPSFNFCADCTYQHRLNMSRAGRCHPPASVMQDPEVACA
jgi:hypothetical protein